MSRTGPENVQETSRFWTFPGPLLDIQIFGLAIQTSLPDWTPAGCPENVQETSRYWTFPGHVLDIQTIGLAVQTSLPDWTPAGHILDLHWTSYWTVSGNFMETPGHNWT
jgi:hypothetical protein